jgi:hypothetical protein
VKTLLRGLGALSIVIGLIWIFQGLNILPGSFMTGHIQWTYYGAGLGAAGAAMIFLSRRRG